MEMESINGLPGGFPGFMLYSDFPSVWIVVLSYCRSNSAHARGVSKETARTRIKTATSIRPGEISVPALNYLKREIATQSLHRVNLGEQITNAFLLNTIS
jgi:hypothetical protein